jgi:ubiquinone/menaquinone biosynthesis C-methylase UbiE
MSIWSEIYKKQMSEFDSLDAFIDNKIVYKKKLIDIIKKYSTKTRRLLEVGCGSGITSIFLEQAGCQVIGIDSDPDMVRLATSIAARQQSSTLFLVDDIKILETVKDQHFDVIYSNRGYGAFSDEDIISIVNLHLSVSNYVICLFL